MEDVDATSRIGSMAYESPVRIRPAEPEDATRISHILAEAFPALYHWIFGRMSTVQTAALLCALYQAQTLSLTTTRLAERDGAIIGVVVLHLGESIGKGTFRAYWRTTRSQVGVWKGIRAFIGGVFANFAINNRIPKGEDLVYIEALAVAAEERGKGVGTVLLQDALQWAGARGRPRMALHVLQSNTGARRLYERMGFRLRSPEPRPVSATSRQRWVSLLMIREPL